MTPTFNMSVADSHRPSQVSAGGNQAHYMIENSFAQEQSFAGEMSEIINGHLD